MSIEPEVRPELWPPTLRRRQGTLHLGALGVTALVGDADRHPVLVVDESAVRGRALVWLTAMDEAFWPGYGMAGARVYCDPAILGPELSAVVTDVGIELLPAGSAAMPLATTAVAAAARQILADSRAQADPAPCATLNIWGLHYEVPGVCIPTCAADSHLCGGNGELPGGVGQLRVQRQKDIADTLAAVVREAQATAGQQAPAAPLVTVEISRALLQASSVLLCGEQVWSGLSVELIASAERAGRGVVVNAEAQRTVALPVNPTPYATAR